MIVSCLSGEESRRRDIQEALRTRGTYYMGSVEEKMAMDVPTEEDYEQELMEAWDDIVGQELDLETVKKARVREDLEATRHGEIG